MNYWLDLFTAKTWQEFLDSGAEISGFRESRWTTVQKIAKGDCLLCYLTGISRFVGVLEVVSKPFRDTKKIWSDEDFPCRIKVKPVTTLTPETSVPVRNLLGKLSFLPFESWGPAWTGHFRGSPAKWKPADGEAVVASLKAAAANADDATLVAHGTPETLEIDHSALFESFVGEFNLKL